MTRYYKLSSIERTKIYTCTSVDLKVQDEGRADLGFGV